MLVLISDLHLTDASCGVSLPTGAVDVFVSRLNECALQASWRADGRYKPVERIDLVLLGDILDTTRSTRWHQTQIRPWDDPQSPAVVEAVGGIVDGILQHNSQSITSLRRLAADSAIRLPVATQAGQPDYNSQPLSVAVRTQYMVGNHDWYLHLRGASYDLIRQKVSHHLGLANSHTAPFPHDPVECDELLGTLRRHRVLARHGDIFDPLSFTEDRDTSSLSDAIIIELVNRFAGEVQQDLGNHLPDAVAVAIQEIDNIRPLLLIPVWLDGVLERCCHQPSIRKQIKKTWDRLADAFLQLNIVREHDSWSPFALVDGLEGALKFSKRWSIGWAAKTNSWLHSLRGSANDSYYQHALAEQDFRNRRARHIVYGHTHHAETVPLDASFADSFVLNQMYFNAGTWRRVYRPTMLAPSQHEFIPAEAISLLSFFQGDERGGRPFETWSGTLGVGLNPAPVRGNTNVSIHAAQQSTAAAKAPIAAPHFRSTLSGRTTGTTT